MPAATILQTKLFVPRPRPQLVPRPHLIIRLNEGLLAPDGTFARKLTLVSAPAGYGKSTLLAEWVRESDTPMAWLSLETADDEPARFWSYFFTAVKTVQPRTGEEAPAAPRGLDDPPIETLLTTWINEIASTSGRCGLVLDDYHLIDNPAVHRALGFLLEHAPPNLHLALATRSDPPLPLSRLRSRGQINEVRTADLRFSRGEIQDLLGQTLDLTLSADQTAALESRTEGWIAGLQLAVHALGGTREGHRPEAAQRFLAGFSGSQRYILDYLTDEVLLGQPESVQTFLRQTAILDHLTGSLCDAVTGRDDGQLMLDRLDEANLFIVPLDDERRWYRYHHLFRELLSKRQRAAGDDPGILHHRACAWFERNGLLASAVSHALAAGDIPEVARLVGGNGLALLDHGELGLLQRMLARLDYKVGEGEPWLCVARAWMLAFTSQSEAVDPELRQAEAYLEGGHLSSMEIARLQGHIAAARTCLAVLQGDRRATERFASEALDLLPEDDLATRGWSASMLGLAHHQNGEVALADRWHLAAVGMGRRIVERGGPGYVAVLALCNLGSIRVRQGRLREAAGYFREALDLSEAYAARAGRPLPISSYAHLSLAGVLSEWNELAAALSHLQEAVALAEAWGEPIRLGAAYMGLAEVHLYLGDARKAASAIDRARQVAGDISPWSAARVAMVEALIHLAQGDLEAASRWATAHEAGAFAYFDTFEHWDGCLVKARIDIARGRSAEALPALRQVETEAMADGGGAALISALIWQAVALKNDGRAGRAVAVLTRALSLAEPERYIRSFLDGGEPVRRLIVQAVTRGVNQSYGRRLLTAFEAETDGTEAQAPSGAVGPTALADPLTPRELEVLRLLTTPLTRPEIAGHLIISENTVRTHLKNIYSKLDVHSREAAVQRGEALGLLK